MNESIKKERIYCDGCRTEIRNIKNAYLNCAEGLTLCNDCNDNSPDTYRYINIDSDLFATFDEKNILRFPRHRKINICFIYSEFIIKSPKELPDRENFDAEIKDGHFVIYFNDNALKSSFMARNYAICLYNNFKSDIYRQLYFVIDNETDKICAMTFETEESIKELDFSLNKLSVTFKSAHSVIRERKNFNQNKMEEKKMRQNSMTNFSFTEFFSFVKQRIIGNDKQIKQLCFGIWKNYRNVISNEDYRAENYMLTGTSGSGKTEFFRAVRDFFKQKHINVPVVQIDLSQITETGFKGNNMDFIPQTILKNFPECGGTAICFLDEADKKLKPTFDAHGNNVNSNIQSNLLTLVEGIESTYEINDRNYPYDSNKTMFIFAGAFQELRNTILPPDKRTAGVGRDIGHRKNSHFDEITLDDMIKFGMQKELAGRISRVVNFQKIPEDTMKKILREKAKQIAADNNVQIEISNKAIEELLEISYTELGMRKPMNKISELIDDALICVIDNENFSFNKYRIFIDSCEQSRAEIIKSEEKNHFEV